MKASGGMHVDLEDLENEDADELGEEESVAELCRPPLVRHYSEKIAQRIVGDLIDSAKREEARTAAASQDAERRHIESTCFDINGYGSGPATIPDLCFVKKRKVR
jgi:hypothetical protein